jgi:dolichol kinase
MLTKHEIGRKIIHLASVFVIPSNIFIGHEFTIYFLIFVIPLYFISEILRVRKIYIPLISDVTGYCSYNFEKKYFVYSPLIFAISILVLITFFPETNAYVGIIALTLGDGISGLIGKQFGKTKLFYNKKKSLEGSTSMFILTFIISFIFVQKIVIVFILSFIATLVESISNEAIDNFTVPFSVSLIMFLLT